VSPQRDQYIERSRDSADLFVKRAEYQSYRRRPCSIRHDQ
jgi:hypothetical protein